jgi:uncharacterized protein involved in exopolysaccharide biosynthesis
MSSPESKPMRVSDWTRPTTAAAPAGPPPGAAFPPPATPPNPPADDTPGLPVDPLRLLGGIWQRRRWLVLGSLAGLVLGLTYALVFTSTRYEVSVQLIRREVPSSFRAGEIGETYKPRTLTTPTLVGLAGSDNVLNRVVLKSEPHVSLGLLRNSIEVRDVRGTDYVHLTLSGYGSAAATVALANLWAQEIVEFTREMQARESKEIRQYLQQQIDSTEMELKRINTSILDYSRREGLVDADRQIDAYLRALGELDLHYETARLDYDAAGFKLKNLEGELAHQSPQADKLRTARTELEEARSRFTDRNPIVQERLERVRALEADTASVVPAETGGDLSHFAGTFLGNTFYLQVIELRNQREALKQQMAQLNQLREEARTKLAAIPEKQLGLAQLARTRQSLESARSLLFSRLREAQLFEERSPGYYQIFSPAATDSVAVRSKLIKLLAFALAGLVAGTGAALAAALGFELLDFRLRTGPEAARAWGAPLFAALPGPGPDATARIWLRWLGQRATTGHVRAVLVPSPDDSEEQFWAALITEARRLLPGLVVIDFTVSKAAPPPTLAALPPGELAALPPASGPVLVTMRIDAMSLESAQETIARLRQAAGGGRELWCRLPGPLREPLTSLARIGAPPLVVVCAGRETLGFWRDQSALLAGTVGAAAGVVLTGATEWKNR